MPSRTWLGIRYLAQLPAFLRQTLSPEACRALIARQMARRREAFLTLLDGAVWNRPASPYRRLLDHAGIARDDVARWVGGEGVEAALGRLYDAGVRLTLEEFKGRRPVCRPGLEFSIDTHDVDNPLLSAGYGGRTSGSRSRGHRVIIDHRLLTYEAACDYVSLDALGLLERPLALWRPPPPGVAGIKDLLRSSKRGSRVDRWFTPTPLWTGRRDWSQAAFTWSVIGMAGLAGRRLAVPRHVPPAEAASVARWLSRCRADGRPALLDAAASGAVRISLAARDAGFDISGTVFRVGGEPYTPTRDRVVREAGCRAVPRYSMAEAGTLGIACARPEAIDEVHLLTDKVAVLQRGRIVSDSGLEVGSLVLTTLLEACPKVMINVEIDDYGVLSARRCGCPLEAMGLGLHLHTIRSYDKLTSAGVSFLGEELTRLLEDALPARFGGAPTDYQLVEHENADGTPRIDLVVHPRLGALDPAALVETALGYLAGGGAASSADRMAAGLWRAGAVLTVVRQAPQMTASGKILALHVVSGTRPRVSRPDS